MKEVLSFPGDTSHLVPGPATFCLEVLHKTVVAGKWQNSLQLMLDDCELNINLFVITIVCFVYAHWTKSPSATLRGGLVTSDSCWNLKRWGSPVRKNPPRAKSSLHIWGLARYGHCTMATILLFWDTWKCLISYKNHHQQKRFLFNVPPCWENYHHYHSNKKAPPF